MCTPRGGRLGTPQTHRNSDGQLEVVGRGCEGLGDGQLVRPAKGARGGQRSGPHEGKVGQQRHRDTRDGTQLRDYPLPLECVQHQHGVQQGQQGQRGHSGNEDAAIPGGGKKWGGVAGTHWMQAHTGVVASAPPH